MVMRFAISFLDAVYTGWFNRIKLIENRLKIFWVEELMKPGDGNEIKVTEIWQLFI